MSRRRKAVREPEPVQVTPPGVRPGVTGACPTCRTLIRKLNQPDDCDCGRVRREGSWGRLEK